MKGLELSRRFYETYGAPMLSEKFPEFEDKLAIGLVGDGSECFGYDDDISRDHDFEPGFCIFVPDDIDSRTEFRLERAYAKLPKSFEGVEWNQKVLNRYKPSMFADATKNGTSSVASESGDESASSEESSAESSETSSETSETSSESSAE